MCVDVQSQGAGPDDAMAACLVRNMEDQLREAPSANPRPYEHTTNKLNEHILRSYGTVFSQISDVGTLQHLAALRDKYDFLTHKSRGAKLCTCNRNHTVTLYQWALDAHEVKELTGRADALAAGIDTIIVCESMRTAADDADADAANLAFEGDDDAHHRLQESEHDRPQQ
ncbi:hypothetical protein KEM55_004258 [Ascosphaera atra]|nr:hypothetical protein KEM55_004258 [Ascosphaera atra]